MKNDIRTLLKTARVEVSPESFSLVSLDEEQWRALLANPEHSPRMTAPFMILKDRWEVTLLVDDKDFAAMKPGLNGAKIEKGLRLLTFDVTLDFAVVGFLSFISDRLAAANVPILAISAFSRDHLLINQIDLARALLVIGEFVDDVC